jgi:glycine cleavage system H protein
MQHPDDLRYTRTHEWVRLDGDHATVGITDYAQKELGDVVYLELPAVGKRFQAGAAFGTVESVKAVSDLYAPLEGEVVAVNEALLEAPEAINSSPYGDGWMLVFRIADPSQVGGLLDAAQYESEIAGH